MTRRINPQVRQHRYTRVEEDLVVAALIAGLAAAVLLAAALLAVPLWSTLAAY